MEVEQKNIYILLSQTDTIITKGIKIFTKAKYNHVSLGFDKSLEKDLYSFGRYKAHNPFWGGFIEESIRKGIFAVKKNSLGLVYQLSVSKENYLKLKSIIDKMIAQKHKYRFNIVGLLLVAVNFPLRRKYKKYCAEFVSEVLDFAKIHLAKKLHALVKPHEFSEIKNAKKIFEGKLIDYQKV